MAAPKAEVGIRRRRPKGMDETEWFWLGVNKSDGCWLWRRGKSDGYGSLKFRGRVTRAHIVAYMILCGPVPHGMVLDHTCRTHNCVRPDHLEPVTNEVNILRGEGALAKLARQTHCKNGHEFTTENTSLLQRRGYASRVCRACSSAYKRGWERRRKENATREGGNGSSQA